MMKLALALTGLLVAGALLAPASQAQNATPPAPTMKQRAPGVPITPHSGDAARGQGGERGQARGGQRGPNDERPPPQPQRDPPMPKPVPSIIAPTR
jgi:hypothetical protein